MNKEALKLPDSLLVRYYRESELENVSKVTSHNDGRLEVRIKVPTGERIDYWRDLGGGLGIVPAGE